MFEYLLHVMVCQPAYHVIDRLRQPNLMRRSCCARLCSASQSRHHLFLFLIIITRIFSVTTTIAVRPSFSHAYLEHTSASIVGHLQAHQSRQTGNTGGYQHEHAWGEKRGKSQ